MRGTSGFFFYWVSLFMFGIFSFASDKALARSLVAELVHALSPAMISSKRKILSVNKVTRLLEQTFHRATEHQQNARLGFVRRAVLANAFKWELLEAGYPKDFVDMATEGLVVELSRARRAPAKEAADKAP